MEASSFKYTTAIDRLRSLTARKKVIQGGTSAGKTFAIISVLIDLAAKKPKLKITVVAESIPAVKDGAKDIFQQIMIDTGRWVQDHWISNPMEYTFTNGSKIQFKSFDSVGKAKASGKRDILFMNECNHISFNIADALMIRSKETWMDYNPDDRFWAHDEVLPEPNSEFLLLSYMDNEALPKETLEDINIKLSKAYFDPFGDRNDVNNIKNSYWANWCRVYVDGEIGNLEGVIFNNWKQIDKVPEDAKYTGSGMDFGYTNDPTTLIDRYYWNGKRIYDEVVHQKGLLNSDIASLCKQGFNRKIWADSAEPKSIDEIKRHGVNIVPVSKGTDSIKYGISLMQEGEFLVTNRSLNMIKELRAYKWDTDKLGNTTQKPIDFMNHTIDGARYVEMGLAMKPIPMQLKRSRLL